MTSKWAMKAERLILVSLLLSGCTTLTWMRPDTNAEQTQQDGAECRIGAYGKYPYREVVVEHEHSATTTEDGNEMLRDAEASYCMRTKGYTLQSAR
jgi:hypothetical protein